MFNNLKRLGFIKDYYFLKIMINIIETDTNTSNYFNFIIYFLILLSKNIENPIIIKTNF